MSERRRRHSSEGSSDGGGGVARKIGTAIAWVLGIFLAANFAVSALRQDETGRPSGLVTEEFVAAVALWVPIGVFAAAAIAGAWFAWRSYQRHEREGALWTMRAFIVSIVLCVALVIGVFEFDRRWFAVAAAILLAAQTTLFAFAAYRELGRRGASAGGRTRAEPAGTSSYAPVATPGGTNASTLGPDTNPFEASEVSPPKGLT